MSEMGNLHSFRLSKNSIEKTYPDSKIAGDGQVVKVKFADRSSFEVLPAFKNSDNSFTFANSNSGGSWQKTNPIPEIEAVNNGNVFTNYNLRELCRMMRSWKYYCNVPIKGILIDTLAHRFLTNWEHRNQSYLYYDWMSRDFFEYLKNQNESQTIWYALGSEQTIYNPDNFTYKATVAFNISKVAIDYHKEDKEWSSKQEWRKVYGSRFPD